jgi:hypothetical protein
LDLSAIVIGFSSSSVSVVCFKGAADTAVGAADFTPATICADTVLKQASQYGTPAIFSKRLSTSNSEQILVAGSTEYKAVCRYHFLH